jgi:V/A-type H+-transporting ATPase subunit E
MAQNIQSFVETLKTEGVDAGQKAAQQIVVQAKGQAEQIVAQAKAEADKIRNQAKAEADQVQARMTSSLELATRDAILMLQERLSRLLTALLSRKVEQGLSDEDTLSAVLREVVLAYAKTSAQGKVAGEIHLPKDMHGRLVNGALQELVRALKQQEIQTEVKASLAKAGFEYKIQGSTVEVSVESVTSLLSEMIDPELRKILASAAGPKVA